MSELESFTIRRFVGLVEETRHEGGPAGDEPLVKAAAGVVIENPFAGAYSEDLTDLTANSPALGEELGRRAIDLLGDRTVESYGKGGIAGLAGEQEHVVACITTPFGDAFRDTVGGGRAWISSATKTAAAGTPLDIPLAFKDEVYVRSHYDAMTFQVADAPRHDELFICVAVATGPRVHHRVGGMTAGQARSELATFTQ